MPESLDAFFLHEPASRASFLRPISKHSFRHIGEYPVPSIAVASDFHVRCRPGYLNLTSQLLCPIFVEVQRIVSVLLST